MTTSQSSYPKDLLEKVTLLIIPDTAPSEAQIELSIMIDESDLRIRDLVAFLELIDRTYGRLSPQGLRSYAHKREDQIQVTEVRPGSLEIIFSEVLTNLDKITIIIALQLLLKYLPDLLKSLAIAFREFEEARYIHLRREHLQNQIANDPALASLEKRDRDELAEFLDELIVKERRNLPAVLRFAQQHVREVSLLVSEHES